jgi:hypothetical protein
MKIGDWHFRLPVVRYVDLELTIEEELIRAVKRTMGEEFAQGVEELKMPLVMPKGKKTFLDGYEQGIHDAAREVRMAWKKTS